jgi:hypothetical protein
VELARAAQRGRTMGGVLLLLSSAAFVLLAFSLTG